MSQKMRHTSSTFMMEGIAPTKAFTTTWKEEEEQEKKDDLSELQSVSKNTQIQRRGNAHPCLLLAALEVSLQIFPMYNKISKTKKKKYCFTLSRKLFGQRAFNLWRKSMKKDFFSVTKINSKAYVHQNLRPLWYKMYCITELSALHFFCQLFIYIVEVLHVVSHKIFFTLQQNGALLH